MGRETRQASLGSLWSARCAQLEPGLGIADLHGVEPSAHNGDDRKLPNWPHLEIVHVKAGNQAHAAEDRTAAGYRRTRTITPQGGELAPSERSKPVALLPMSEQMKRSCSCRLKPPQPIFRDRDGPNSRAICGSGSVAELLSGRQSTALARRHQGQGLSWADIKFSFYDATAGQYGLAASARKPLS